MRLARQTMGSAHSSRVAGTSWGSRSSCCNWLPRNRFAFVQKGEWPSAPGDRRAVAGAQATETPQHLEGVCLRLASAASAVSPRCADPYVIAPRSPRGCEKLGLDFGVCVSGDLENCCGVCAPFSCLHPCATRAG